MLYYGIEYGILYQLLASSCELEADAEEAAAATMTMKKQQQRNTHHS